MKIASCLFLALLGYSAHAQDFCSKVKKEVSDDKTLYDLTSPFDPENVPPVRVSRNYCTNPDNEFDRFNLIFEVLGDLDNVYTHNAKGEQVEKDEKKIVIEFDDKSKIVDDSIEILHGLSPDRTQSVRYVFFPVTDQNSKALCTKKIVKFSLAGYERTMPEDPTNAFQQYLVCIKSAKK